MRALVIAVVLLVTARAEVRADCSGISFAPAGATVRGRITTIEWRAPVVVTCPGGRARCFESVLAMASAPTHVRIVLENATHRDARGRTFKLARLVLEGVLPLREGECQSPVIAPGQIRELEVVARTSAPWRVTGAR